MSSTLHFLIDKYNDITSSAITDPILDSWFMMSSPIPVLAIVVFYLYFVLRYGPKMMEKRNPYNPKWLIVAYNAYQVAFNIWFCWTILRHGALDYVYQKGCKSFENEWERRPTHVSNAAWWFSASRIIDLLDTVFFVLKKKTSQVTFLHVYHHVTMAFFSWCHLKYIHVACDHSVVHGFVNALVHVVMYTYYLVAALGPKYQKYIWWKKYITRIQLVQFCFLIAYQVGLLVFDCKSPKSVTLAWLGNFVTYFLLFGLFYIKSYINKKVTPASSGKRAGMHQDLKEK